jgi:hypothetical protein
VVPSPSQALILQGIESESVIWRRGLEVLCGAFLTERARTALDKAEAGAVKANASYAERAAITSSSALFIVSVVADDVGMTSLV